MLKIKWDGSLNSANTVITAINNHFRYEEEPAKLIQDTIFLTITNQDIQRMKAGDSIYLS